MLDNVARRCQDMFARGCIKSGVRQNGGSRFNRNYLLDTG